MDIKLELEEIADPDALNYVGWRMHKEGFINNEATIKTEEIEDENNTDIQQNPTCENETSQYFEIQIDEMDVKNELLKNEDVHIGGRDNCSFRSNNPIPVLVPWIILMRVPFYRKNFVCNLCHDVFPTVADKEWHSLLHEQSAVPVMEYRRSDQRHLVNDGIAMKSYSFCKRTTFCDIAEKCDQTRLEIVQSSGKSNKCDKCDYSCKNLKYMTNHLVLHAMKKSFKCEVCDYLCSRSTHMKNHLMTHSGEKPFKCDQCSYSCITFSNMKNHKMTHSGEKPFHCDQCNYSCITFTRMKAHKMIHSRKKPYKND